MSFSKSILSSLVIASMAVMSGCGSSGGNSGGDTASSTPTSEFPSAVSCDTNNVCVVSGTISDSFTMDAEKTWVLRGSVRVGSGNVFVTTQSDIDTIKAEGITLTIEPGVHVRAEDASTLIVTRGNKIEAVGTAEAPITFSSIDDNFDGDGEWKGLVVQGFAPVYLQGGDGACFKDGAFCNVPGEGGDEVGFFGGKDKADDSGSLQYVRIAEAGFPFQEDKEINSLTLMGVGHGTTLDYIHIHNGKDDGIEWFGGTANLTHAVLTNIDDDDIDFDMGYQGNMQYILVRKHPTKMMPSGSNDPRGIEANSSDGEYTPETAAVLANVTLIGSEVSANEPGMRLRGQVKTNIVNSAVSGFDNCLRIDTVTLVDGDNSQTLYGTNAFTNFLGACTKSAIKGVSDTQDNGTGTDISNGYTVLPDGSTLTFNDMWAITNNEAKLSGSVAAFDPIDNGSDFEFELNDYIGAVDPEADTAWWAGWTLDGTL